MKVTVRFLVSASIPPIRPSFNYAAGSLWKISISAPRTALLDGPLLFRRSEFYLRKHPTHARETGKAMPDPLISSDSKTTRKCALYLCRRSTPRRPVRGGFGVRSGRVQAPALQAQSPRTARGQIQVVGHHDGGEPMG